MNPINYININEILSRLLDNSLLEGLTKERVVSYLVDFINKTGYYPLYQHSEEYVDIKDYRGVLPCDVVSVDMVKDYKTGLCLRAMSDVYNSHEYGHNKCGEYKLFSSDTWKIQGNILYTSFKEGKVLIAYTTIPADEDGYPLLIDNSNFLLALEAYIKVKRFTILFEEGKLQMQILQHAEQEYAFAAGQLRSEMTIPDISEMENLKNMFTSLIENKNHFKGGFKSLGGIQDNINKH